MTKQTTVVLAALVLALLGTADQASWEEQMRARAQSQNEYARSATK